MKRRVVCIGIFVFWGLLVCTILSIRIEELMTVQAVKAELEEEKTEDGFSRWTIPADALIRDTEGMHLFYGEEGEGWEEGTRVKEADPFMYSVEGNSILLPDELDRSYLLYASRPVKVGERIIWSRSYPEGEDCYLVIDPGEPDQSLERWETASVTEEREGVLLVSLSGKQPFYEKQARSELGFSENSKIYSLGDVRKLLETFPLLAGMTALLLMSVILWGYSLRLTRRLRKNRMLLAANALLGAILLWMFRYLSEQVQLPTSLLPAENILEFRYYAEELRQVIRGLEGFSAAAAGRTLEAFPVNLLLSGGILLAGIALISVLIFLEKKVVTNGGGSEG